MLPDPGNVLSGLVGGGSGGEDQLILLNLNDV